MSLPRLTPTHPHRTAIVRKTVVNPHYIPGIAGWLLQMSPCSDKNGKVDASKVRPITFDPFNNEYLVIGEKAGDAFSEGKKLI